MRLKPALSPVIVAIAALATGLAAGYSYGNHTTILGATFYLGTALSAASIGLMALLIALCPTMLALGVCINILAVDLAFHPSTYTIASGGGFIAAALTSAFLWETLSRLYKRRWELIAFIGVAAALTDTFWYNTHRVGGWGSVSGIVGEVILKILLPIIIVRSIYVRNRSSR